MRIAFALLLALLWVPVHGQDAYPTKSVRLIAAAAPGGNPDVLARMLAARLSDTFGRPFVVENIPGAGGVVAAGARLDAKNQHNVDAFYYTKDEAMKQRLRELAAKR